MTKEIRNIVITAIVALFVGYMVGSIMQTGRCPLTGTVICKGKADSCCAKKQAAEQAAPETEATPEAPATPSAEAAH